MWWAILLGLMAVVTATGRAQSPAERAQVSAWCDSLLAIRDTAVLHRIERDAITRLKQGGDHPLAHLRLGHLSLRWFSLVPDEAFAADAASEFEQVTERAPGWPMGWAGLAVAEQAAADAIPETIRNIQGFFGADPYGVVARNLLRSVRADSTVARDFLEVGNAALRERSPLHLQPVLRVIRATATTPALATRDLMILRARIEREVGSPDSALMLLDRLLAGNPNDADALLEQARTRFVLGRADGAAPWFRGLALARDTTLARYRTDLATVLPDSTLAAFDAAAGVDRGDVIRQYWESPGRQAMFTAGERLREHYLRLDHAHRAFAFTPPLGSRYLTGDPGRLDRYDARGIVYVRHGPPEVQAIFPMIGVPKNESWGYRVNRPDEMMVHFVKTADDSGFRQVPSLLDIVAISHPTTATGQGDLKARLSDGQAFVTYGAAWSASVARDLIRSRREFGTRYGRLADAGPGTALAIQQEERARGEADAIRSTTEEEWSLRYEIPLDPITTMVAVGGEGAAPPVQVGFALRGSTLYPRSVRGGVGYWVHLRAMVRDQAGHLVRVVDTNRVFVSRVPVAPSALLVGRQPIALLPGEYQVQVAIETESRGSVLPPQPVSVPAREGSGLTLSDLALGTRTMPLSWGVTRSDTAWLNPTRRFSASEPVQLLFEVGGLKPGDPYTLELAIRKARGRDATVDDAGRESLRLTSRQVRGQGWDRVRREIDISRLDRGQYRIEVVVTGPDGQHARRQQLLTIER